MLFGVNKFIRSTKLRNYAGLLQFKLRKIRNASFYQITREKNILGNKTKQKQGGEKKEQEYQIMQTVDSLRLI